MANSATPIGKLMFSPIIKKADIRTAIIERRLRVDSRPCYFTYRISPLVRVRNNNGHSPGTWP
jgi:hypothetical protein